MLSFKDLNEKKKTAVKINPNLKDVMEKKGEKNCGCGQDPCITYGDDRHKKDKVDKVDEAKKKDDTYLETDFKKRLKNNEKARKDMMKGPQMKNPHFESTTYDSHQEVSEESTEESTENSLLTFQQFDELNRYEKETGKSSGSMNMPKGRPTSKGGSTSKVMRAVRTSIRKETGKPSGQQKKEKGLKSTAGTGKYLEKQKSKKEYAGRAKKAGFKNTQDYTNTVSRYGGEDNYKKGKGLGT